MWIVNVNNWIDPAAIGNWVERKLSKECKHVLIKSNKSSPFADFAKYYDAEHLSDICLQLVDGNFASFNMFRITEVYTLPMFWLKLFLANNKVCNVE